MTEIVPILGGVGLFLLGMTILTDGLKGLAGGALRRVLARFTTSPVSGALVGAATTAVVQSSSATTVTVVGFVGAGLLTFPQALGVIFGANIGTTATGWLVALLGFKLDLGAIVAPLILIGVLLRLFGGRRLQHVGWALAGFGLLFVGIEALQQGMAAFEGAVTPADFPPDTLPGRLQLVGIGVAVTLVTQSSSAGVAVALAALSAGAISFPQAAALAIGMDVGTTFTAALATIGGATATRRTGYAHVLYNIMTGAMAFALLDLFTLAVDALTPGGVAAEPQIALVAFHTAFNAIGVLLALPFAGRFARLIERLTPESGPPLLRRLDERLLDAPASAIDAATATLRLAATALSAAIARRLSPGQRRRRDAGDEAAAIRSALDAVVTYAARIPPSPIGSPTHRRQVAMLHALDHLIRLSARAGQDARIETAASEPGLRRLARVLRSGAERLRSALAADEDLDPIEHRLDRTRGLMRRRRRAYRQRMVELGARAAGTTDRTLDLLDAVRWIQRTSDHLWRIAHHLDDAARERPRASEAPPEASPPEASPRETSPPETSPVETHPVDLSPVAPPPPPPLAPGPEPRRPEPRRPDPPDRDPPDRDP